MTTSYLFRTPENSKFFSISIEGWSYRESTASTFFLLDEDMSRVIELKKYLNDVFVRGQRN